MAENTTTKAAGTEPTVKSSAPVKAEKSEKVAEKVAKKEKSSRRRKQKGLLCDELSFAAAESYKLLRTNLLFALPDQECRIIGVTSSIRGEGKSTTSVNLAYTLAQTGIQRAEENLRTANLGFSEGVISPTVVMEAQTAWLQAKSQLIDAQIAVKLSQVELQKSLGTLE